MTLSWKAKRRFWGAAWGCGVLCMTLALAWQLGRPAGCRRQDLTRIPDDSFAVTVRPVQAQQQTGGAEEKRVFLTFDDGPSPTTEQVLDILEREQVPATFFVIAAPNNEKYLPILKRTAAQGHQIALHSCTHEYSQIYRSPAAYWADLRDLKQKLSPWVEDAEEICWLRFPGGSTNTVSHRYGGRHIMTSLKAQAEERGYHYVDWNVCAGDAAGGHPSADRLLKNVIREAEGKTRCVVLMHDTKATGNTAQALPEIIRWFREQGYRFCRIDALAQEET